MFLFSLKTFFKIFVVVVIFNHVYGKVCAHDHKCPQRSKVSNPSGAGVTGSCKPPGMGAGERTQILGRKRVLLTTAPFWF